MLLRVVQPQFQSEGSFQSNAFQDQSEEQAARFGLAGPCASVSLMSIWLSESGNVRHLLSEFAVGSRLARMRVGEVRRLRLRSGDTMPHGVMLDPRPGAPWHAVMFVEAGGRRNKTGRGTLRDLATEFEF